MLDRNDTFWQLTIGVIVAWLCVVVKPEITLYAKKVRRLADELWRKFRAISLILQVAIALVVATVSERSTAEVATEGCCHIKKTYTKKK